MDSLKFLGKPAPEYIGCCGNGEYCNERTGDKDCPCEAKIQSLEGAIKETKDLLLQYHIQYHIENEPEVYENATNEPTDISTDFCEYVASLLRKTISERT